MVAVRGPGAGGLYESDWRIPGQPVGRQCGLGLNSLAWSEFRPLERLCTQHAGHGWHDSLGRASYEEAGQARPECVCVGGMAAWQRCCLGGIVRELPGIVSWVAGEMIILSAGKCDLLQDSGRSGGHLEGKMLYVNAAVAAHPSVSEPWHWEAQIGSSNPTLCPLSLRVFLKASSGENPLPL